MGFQAALPEFREIRNSGPNNSFQPECQAFFGVASCSDFQLDLYFRQSEVTTYKIRGSFEGGSGRYSSLTFDLEDAIEAQLQANNVGYQANIFIGFFNMDWFDNNASPNNVEMDGECLQEFELGQNSYWTRNIDQVLEGSGVGRVEDVKNPYTRAYIGASGHLQQAKTFSDPCRGEASTNKEVRPRLGTSEER